MTYEDVHKSEDCPLMIIPVVNGEEDIPLCKGLPWNDAPDRFCVCVWYAGSLELGYELVDDFAQDCTKLCPNHYELEEAKKRGLID